MGRHSLSITKLFLTLFAVGSCSTLFAGSDLPNCSTASLASYITTTQNPPASGGCAIGILDYYNFAYLTGNSSPASSAITVTPSGSGFSFGPVTAGESPVSFEIDYDIFIDPAPVIAGDTLGLDVSGTVSITEYFCNDTTYVAGSGLAGSGLCLGSRPAQSLTVMSTNGQPVTNTITFNPGASVSQYVGIVFTLSPGSSFEGLSSDSIVTGIPEPVSAGVTVLGLLTLAGYGLRTRFTR